MNYTPEQLKQIDDEVKKIGIKEYRFLVENNRYICDKNGNIYSLFYNQGRSLNLNIRKLKECHNPAGYVSVAISSVKYDRTKRRHLIHRLIASAWLGLHENLQVNHKNGIRTDNRLENLEFCTPLENLNHRSYILKHEIMKKKICIYLLFRYYNFTEKEIQKIFSVHIKDIQKWLNEFNNAFSAIEFTDTQIKSFFDSVLCEDIIDNKEFLRKIIE